METEKEITIDDISKEGRDTIVSHLQASGIALSTGKGSELLTDSEDFEDACFSLSFQYGIPEAVIRRIAEEYSKNLPEKEGAE